jgi:hypothetical protein
VAASVSGNFGFRIFDFGFEENTAPNMFLWLALGWLSVGHSELVSGFIALAY